MKILLRRKFFVEVEKSRYDGGLIVQKIFKAISGRNSAVVFFVSVALGITKTKLLSRSSGFIKPIGMY